MKKYLIFQSRRTIHIASLLLSLGKMQQFNLLLKNLMGKNYSRMHAEQFLRIFLGKKIFKGGRVK